MGIRHYPKLLGWSLPMGWFNVISRTLIGEISYPFTVPLLLICLESKSETETNQTYKWLVRDAFNKFPDFFVQAFKIVLHSWKFSMLLQDILWDDWLIFMISGSNEQLQQELEYTLIKLESHSWWISKQQSGREDTLEKRYTIKFLQFLMLWLPAMKAGSTAITQRPRDIVPSGSMLALPAPRKLDRANSPTNFWWSHFLTALIWSTRTGFPLYRQSTRIIMLKF